MPKNNFRKHLPKKPRSSLLNSDPVSTKAKSLSNERRLSLELDFRLTPGSGNTPWITKKGDGKTDAFMIECKETVGKKLVINEDILKKLYSEASRAGKEPMLIISLYGLADPLPQDWVVVPARVLHGAF